MTAQQPPDNGNHGSSAPPATFTFSATSTAPICPDLLTLSQLGAADTMRGHIVRAFFAVLKWLP